MSRFPLPLAIATALVITPALAAPALDGWNGYKLGMSPDAARAVPGIAFGPFAADNMTDGDIGAMAAKANVTINGRPYTLNLFFNDRQKLNRIELENQVKAPHDGCEKLFLSLLAQTDKSYGGFAPVNPQHPKTAGDQLSASIVWKAQGPSRYELSSVFFDAETASSWKARKASGANHLDITTTWSGADNTKSAPCITDLEYAG